MVGRSGGLPPKEIERSLEEAVEDSDDIFVSLPFAHDERNGNDDDEDEGDDRRKSGLRRISSVSVSLTPGPKRRGGIAEASSQGKSKKRRKLSSVKNNTEKEDKDEEEIQETVVICITGFKLSRTDEKVWT
jgi:hypothetical protein